MLSPDLRRPTYPKELCVNENDALSLSDEEIESGEAMAASELGDADGTDSGDADGTDSADADGTDSGDADGTDA